MLNTQQTHSRLNRHIFRFLSLIFLLAMAMLVLNLGYVQAQTPGRIPMFDPGAGSCNAGAGVDCIDSGIGTDSNGNLFMPDSDGTGGNIFKNGTLFLHNFGSNNTFLGKNAGNLTTTADANIGIGLNALSNNNTGNVNTAVGVNALLNTTTGEQNTAIGGAALRENRGGSSNTAVGRSALRDMTFGDDNIAIGTFAGVNLPNGFTNIYIGHPGPTIAESNTIRIGRPVGHNRFFAAGVRGVTTDVANAVPVLIDSNGQLGTTSSSRRFKEEIRDMGEASSGLMRLRPVTFRYKKAYADGSRPLDYGLIAEEVAEVYPDLVVYSSTGEVETVQYQKLNVMLLNEIQKQRREIAELKRQAAENAELKARLENLEGMVRNAAYRTRSSRNTE
jgi:hypothetical protein